MSKVSYTSKLLKIMSIPLILSTCQSTPSPFESKLNPYAQGNYMYLDTPSGKTYKASHTLHNLYQLSKNLIPKYYQPLLENSTTVEKILEIIDTNSDLEITIKEASNAFNKDMAQSITNVLNHDYQFMSPKNQSSQPK